MGRKDPFNLQIERKGDGIRARRGPWNVTWRPGKKKMAWKEKGPALNPLTLSIENKQERE